MDDEWLFVASDSRLGDWQPSGGYTLEQYVITPRGTWVPAVDWEWLKPFEKKCPGCKSKGAIQMFHMASPSAEQMKEKPLQSPRVRGRAHSNFGVRKQRSKT